MNERILVGLVVGLVGGVGTWVWYSDFFTKTQKVFIIVSLLFPPGAIAVIALISAYNMIVKPNKPGEITEPVIKPESLKEKLHADVSTAPLKDLKEVEKSIEKLKELHARGLFNDSELSEKIGQLEKQIQSINEHRKREEIDLEVQKSEEYKLLLELKTSGVIDGKVFDRKVKKLVENKMNGSPETRPKPAGDEGFVDTHNHLILAIVLVIVAMIVIAATIGQS